MIEYRPTSRAECGRVLDMLCKLNVAWESDLKGEITIQDGPERVHMWAPDTLAALRELLRETDQHAEGSCPKLLAACTASRAAIAAATGA